MNYDNLPGFVTGLVLTTCWMVVVFFGFAPHWPFQAQLALSLMGAIIIGYLAGRLDG